METLPQEEQSDRYQSEPLIDRVSSLKDNHLHLDLLKLEF